MCGIALGLGGWMAKPRNTQKDPATAPAYSYRPMAVASILQSLGALLVVGIGVYYDQTALTPGILTLAGLGILAGPGFFVALRRAVISVALPSSEDKK